MKAKLPINDTVLQVKKMRRLINEEDVNVSHWSSNDISNNFDEKNERKKFIDYLRDYNVSIEFIPLEATVKYVFWGGTINNSLQFTYSVTNDDSKNNVNFNYLNDFNPSNEENSDLIKKITDYYNTFYKYWISYIK